MSKVSHFLFTILSLVFIIIAIVNLVSVMQSDINLTVEESTLPSCIEDTEDLLNELTMKYVWEIMLWITLGGWHILQFIDDWS